MIPCSVPAFDLSSLTLLYCIFAPHCSSLVSACHDLHLGVMLWPLGLSMAWLVHLTAAADRISRLEEPDTLLPRPSHTVKRDHAPGFDRLLRLSWPS
eukprot:767356-Hanusia_phi.AAC.2